MSDTPRMEAANMAAMEHGTGNVWRVGCDIERELNAANVEIDEKRKDIVYLATEKAKLEERIKQLQEMYEGEPGERPDLLGSNVMGLLKRELIGTQKRIKELEAENDAMREDLLLWSEQEAEL